MSMPTGNTEPSYKNDPAYKITSIIFPVLVAIIVFLFIWFSRGEIKLKEPRTITLYCFSAMELVMEQALVPAFQDMWLEQNQEQVEFITTFAGSGVITRQIITRFPAEVAVLSSELDARRLVGSGAITAAVWQELRKKDKFCRSPIVLFVREEFETSIKSFDDIDFSKMNVIIPDPLTSGEGQLAALALYGSRLRQGFTKEQAFDFVTQAFTNSRNHPSTSQDAMEQFHAGLGDILLNYEAAAGNHPGVSEMKIIHPQRTIMTEPIAVAIKTNIKPKQTEIVNAFLGFLWSDKAKKILSDYGFQTINISQQAGFAPTPLNDIFTLDSLGSAMELNRSVIDPLAAQE
ncbi:MAG: substrate-binding domain-containing protein [Candidatus Marinimicrobia bacterium]|nr:substrate-binding domain-containing protein [Candidatus Neomarinimicrobiota bacterium]